MLTETSAFPVAAVIRSLLGWGIKYVSCSILTLLLLLCFAALMFAQVALWGPDIWWMRYLLPLLPDSLTTHSAGTLHSNDLGALFTRVFTVLSLALTAIALVWRWFRQWRGGARIFAVSMTTVVAPLAKHVAIHGRRRMLVGLAAVSAVFAFAFLAIPHARMAAGSSHAGMLWVFAVLYVFALVLTVLYVSLGIVADWVLDA